MKTYFEYSSNIMSKHIGHQSISILSIAHVEGDRNIFNNLDVVQKENESSMKPIDVKVFLLFLRCLSEHYLVNHFKVTGLHYANYLMKIELDTPLLLWIFCLRYPTLTKSLAFLYLHLVILLPTIIPCIFKSIYYSKT